MRTNEIVRATHARRPPTIIRIPHRLQASGRVKYNRIFSSVSPTCSNSLHRAKRPILPRRAHERTEPVRRVLSRSSSIPPRFRIISPVVRVNLFCAFGSVRWTVLALESDDPERLRVAIEETLSRLTDSTTGEQKPSE